MSTTRGRTHADFYHPTQDDVYCSIEIKWAHHVSSATLEQPGEDDVVIEDTKLITYCGEYVNKMEVPDWVSLDDIYEAIDPMDYYDDYED